VNVWVEEIVEEEEGETGGMALVEAPDKGKVSPRCKSRKTMDT